MKRYDIIALLLVIYLAVMAYFGRGMLLSGITGNILVLSVLLYSSFSYSDGL